jgi:replicative DNA helicase
LAQVEGVKKMELEKVPPQNLEAEVAVIGAILQENEAIHRAIETLRKDDFYREAHRKIYEACLVLFERNESIDLITLSNELQKRRELEEVGGASYLTYLVDSVPTAANIGHHAKIIRDKAILRDLIFTSTSIVQSSFEAEEEVDDILDEAEKRIFGISQHRFSYSLTPLRSVLKGSFELIERLYERKAHVTGVPTGFSDFDVLTCGLQPTNLIIIAGRPSVGKTSFCLDIARHAATQESTTVAIFSLEESKEQVAQRMLCSQARVGLHRLRRGYLKDEDWGKLTTAAGVLADAPIFVDDSPALSVLEMKTKARRLKAEQGLGLILVDYLQLIQNRRRMENRQQEISEISRSLKALAKELDVPVVALSQLSRRVEERQGQRPQLSDLRESGALEQDADLVAFIYRPKIYEPPEEVDQKRFMSYEERQEGHPTEVIVGKQRNGPTGTVTLTFLPETLCFKDSSDRTPQPNDNKRY